MPSVEMPKEFTKTKKQKNFTFTKKKKLIRAEYTRSIYKNQLYLYRLVTKN